MDARLYERKLTALVTYDEVLRDPNVFLLHLILDVPKIRKQFKDYFDEEKFDCQSEAKIHTMLLNRTVKNFLEWGALKEFDYERNYDKMYHQFKSMYEKSPALAMYDAFVQMIKESFLDKMFIWNPKEDRRQEYDIVKTFGKNPKVQYVTGPYLDVVDAIGEIHIFVDNDIDRLDPVIRTKKYRHANFSVARYGYNYEIGEQKLPMLKNDIASFVSRYHISLAEFLPFKVSIGDTLNG